MPSLPAELWTSLTRNTKLFWILAALVWGTIRLFTTWTSSKMVEEKLWGFGQVLALLLIALPFLSLSEKLFKGSKLIPRLKTFTDLALQKPKGTHLL
jgi:hypothetical protein